MPQQSLHEPSQHLEQLLRCIVESADGPTAANTLNPADGVKAKCCMIQMVLQAWMVRVCDPSVFPREGLDLTLRS